MISNQVRSPEYINVVDDSDDEVTCLGTFASSTELSENSQPSICKEEVEDINQGVLGSNYSGARKSQQIISCRGNVEDRTSMANLNIFSPLVEEKTSIKEKPCSKSPKHPVNSTNCSILSSTGTNRLTTTTIANTESQPSLENVQSYCVSTIDKSPNEMSKVPFVSSEKEPVEIAKLSSLSSLVSGKSQTNICLPNENMLPFGQRVTNTNSSPNIIRRPETVNKVPIQKSTHSSVMPFLSSMSSSSIPEMKSIGHSPLSVQNLSNAAQPKFGSKIKQQIRYVTLPAKFLAEKSARQLLGNNPSGSNLIQVVHGNASKQPVNQNILKGELNCNGVKGPNIYVPDVVNPNRGITAHSGPIVEKLTKATPKIVFVKNNSSAAPKSNIVKDQYNVGPPPMLLLNNQIFKLKGIKKQDSLLKNSLIDTSDAEKMNEPHVPVKCVNCGSNKCCQMNKSTKSFVDESCQTNIYSWIYKNSKLYTFIDDGGKQVEIVPVKTVRVEKPPIETDVASPVSSLDNESDSSEDEISVTDEPIISKNKMTLSTVHSHPSPVFARPSTVNAALQTDYAKSCNGLEPNPSNKLPGIYQPENTFQEVLYNDLGISNTTQRPRVSVQSDSFDNQNNYENNTRHQEDESINTVYNHELQMYVTSSQNKRSEPLFQQPAVVTPNNNHNNAVVDILNKLIVDIKTCLTSDALGNIPLHHAAVKHDLVKLRSQCIVLKTIGSNLNHINLAHETALMVAVKVAVKTGEYEAVSTLVSEGAALRVADLDGNTPLHYAVRHGSSQLVSVLLSADDADKVTEKFNYDGFTPLHIAAMEGYDDIITILVGTNIDINIKDRKNGRTPYFLAVKEKKLTTANRLKMFGADVNVPNFADQMPFSVATPEKTLPQPQDPDDPGLLDDSHLEILEKEKIPDVSLLSQVISEPSFVFVGRNETGLKQVLNGNDLKKDKEIVDRTSESFDAKELYKKYVKIAEKRKLVSHNEEPSAKLKNVFVKKTMGTPVALNKTVDLDFHSRRAGDSSSNGQNQSSESEKDKHYNQSQPLCFVKNSVEKSQIQNYSKGKFDQVQIDSDSVTYNKAVLTPSNVFFILNDTSESLSDKSLNRDQQSSCKSSSEVHMENHPSQPQLRITNPISDNLNSANKTQSKDFISHSSPASLHKNGHNILSDPLCISVEISKLSEKMDLLTKTQVKSLAPLKVKKSNSEDNSSLLLGAKTNLTANQISHCSSTDDKNSDQNTPLSTMAMKTKQDISDKKCLLNKSREKRHAPGWRMEKSSDSKKKRKNKKKNSSQGSEITVRNGSGSILKKRKPNSVSSKEEMKLNDDNMSLEITQTINNSNMSTFKEDYSSAPLSSFTSEEISNTGLMKPQHHKIQDKLHKSTCKLKDEKSPSQNLNFETQLAIDDRKILENETSCDSINENSCFECCFDLDVENVKDIIIGNDSLKPSDGNPTTNSSTPLLEKRTEPLKLSYNTILDEVVSKNIEENSSSQKADNKENNQQRKPVDYAPDNNVDVSLNNSKCTDHQSTNDPKIIQTDLSDSTMTSTERPISPFKEVSNANQTSSIDNLNDNPKNATESRELTENTVIINNNINKEVPDANQTSSIDNLNDNPKNITESRELTESTVIFNNNKKKVSDSKDTKTKKNKAPKPKATKNKKKTPITPFSSDPNRIPVPNSPKALVTNMRNKLVSLVSCKVSLPVALSSNNASEDSNSPKASTKSQVLEILESRNKRRSIESLLNDIESNPPEEIDRLAMSSLSELSASPSQEWNGNTKKRRLDSMGLETKKKTIATSSIPKLIESQSQEKRIKFRKKSLDSVGSETQESVNKKLATSSLSRQIRDSQGSRIKSRKKSLDSVEFETKNARSTNTEVTTSENNPLPNVISRKSSRTPKKKVEFDL